jgi:hypothetical protein
LTTNINNSDDERQVAKQARKEELRGKQRESDLRSILQTPEGKRFMWYLLSDTNIFGMTFVPDDPYQTAFNEGRRNVGTMLLALINEQCPEEYLEMMTSKERYNV